MQTQIYRLPLGFSTCYLVKQEGLILVDTGTPNQAKKFLNELKALSINPADISLILLTHGHWDHIGSANEIKRLTASKVAINHREKDWVEQAIKITPPGISLWGSFLGMMLKMLMPVVSFPGTSVDLALEDSDFSLEPYGISGQVLYTPGHSMGSMSLLLDTGEAFVGDSAMNGLPMRTGPGLPIFAEDMNAVKESWRLLLTRGAKQIYPAHGKPFEANIMERFL
jgi:glyoxylase-like metal-dependent hydrolase (beta-lactamase superfamily II)